MNYSSGLPFTEIEGFEILNPQGQPLDIDIDYGGINRNYLGETIKLNLSDFYILAFRQSDAKAIIMGSVVNLLNRKNVWSQTFFIDAPHNQDPRIQTLGKVNLPFNPNLSIRVEF